jgi:hypothetical protein
MGSAAVETKTEFDFIVVGGLLTLSTFCARH